MAIIFSLFIFVGLVMFVLVFLRGLAVEKGTDEVASASFMDAVSRIFPMVSFKKSLSGPAEPLSMLKTVRADSALAAEELNKKCDTLEKLLEEKNRAIDLLQKEQDSLYAAKSEFETLKSILQRQIDDLKASNKVLKEDLDRVRQENSSLRSPEVSSPLQGQADSHSVLSDAPITGRRYVQSDSDFVRAEPEPLSDVNVKEALLKEEDFSVDDVPRVKPSLKDIFGDDGGRRS
jgi:prefoldin subunit 5